MSRGEGSVLYSLKWKLLFAAKCNYLSGVGKQGSYGHVITYVFYDNCIFSLNRIVEMSLG